MSLNRASSLSFRKGFMRATAAFSEALVYAAWRQVNRRAAIATARSAEMRGKRVPGVHLRLASHPDVQVRQYLASRPGDPRFCRYQEALAVDEVRTVRSTLARCSGFVCATALTELAVDDDASVRAVVAERHDLPPLVWNVLAHDPSVAVRLRLARNPAAHADVIRLLCSDPESQVRNAAKNHRNASPDALVEVALRAGS